MSKTAVTNRKWARQLARRTSGRALGDLFDGVPDAARQALGLTHESLLGGIFLAAAALDHPMLNRLVAAPPHAVDPAVRRFRTLGVRRFLLTFREVDLDQALQHGLEHGLVRFRRPWATLLRTKTDASPLPPIHVPDGMALRPATAADSSALGTLMATAFDLPARAAPVFAAAIRRPRWNALVVENAGEIAGAGIAFLHDDCAYLAGGATRPEYRRRGVQRALVAARVRWAADAGTSVICSETGVAVPGQSNPSFDNLVRAGLRPVGVSEHLCFEGTAWAESR